MPRFIKFSLLTLVVTVLGITVLADFLTVPEANAQVSGSTGSITGTVTDPQGAAVADAKVTITNKETGLSQSLSANATGYYTSGTLVPGEYTVRIEAKNFKTYQTTLSVQVGQIITVNVKLELGSSSSVVEVTSAAIQVNEEQASVQMCSRQKTLMNCR